MKDVAVNAPKKPLASQKRDVGDRVLSFYRKVGIPAIAAVLAIRSGQGVPGQGAPQEGKARPAADKAPRTLFPKGKLLPKGA